MGEVSPKVTERVSPINQNLNDKLMFIGVLYFVVGEDNILPQRTITACFREANSLPYGICALPFRTSNPPINQNLNDKLMFVG